jgi:hemerythrin
MIDKNKLPLVENSTMNDIHYEEVDIINELAMMIESGKLDNITDQITKLIEHIQKHFSFEEDMMRSKSYPMYTVHQSDHNKVLSEIRYIFMDWRTAKDIERLKEYFEEELPDWLDQHIKAMDIPMAEFMSTK